jgi:cytochrome P450
MISALRPWLEQGSSLVLLYEPLRRELCGRGPWGRFVASRRRIDALLDAHIAARRRDPAISERTDVLSRLLVADARLDDLSVRDELMTMLAAGHDTSATALAWAFSLLLRHPAELRRLVAEIDAGESDEYLDAVVKEALRLTPVVLEVGRTLTHDAVIDGTTIPAGAGAVANILLAQRDPDRYPEPHAFRPERFLNQPADPHSFLPFGGGIRRCIGAAFAILEIKTVLRTVLSEVELRAVGRMDKPRRRAVTMIPSHGTRVVVTASRLLARVSPPAGLKGLLEDHEREQERGEERGAPHDHGGQQPGDNTRDRQAVGHDVGDDQRDEAREQRRAAKQCALLAQGDLLDQR